MHNYICDNNVLEEQSSEEVLQEIDEINKIFHTISKRFSKLLHKKKPFLKDQDLFNNHKTYNETSPTVFETMEANENILSIFKTNLKTLKSELRYLFANKAANEDVVKNFN